MQNSFVGRALDKLTEAFDDVLTSLREELPQADQKRALFLEALIAQPSEESLSNG
jgi:hypothetical protein